MKGSCWIFTNIIWPTSTQWGNIFTARHNPFVCGVMQVLWTKQGRKTFGQIIECDEKKLIWIRGRWGSGTIWWPPPVVPLQSRDLPGPFWTSPFSILILLQNCLHWELPISHRYVDADDLKKQNSIFHRPGSVLPVCCFSTVSILTGTKGNMEACHQCPCCQICFNLLRRSCTDGTHPLSSLHI